MIFIFSDVCDISLKLRLLNGICALGLMYKTHDCVNHINSYTFPRRILDMVDVLVSTRTGGVLLLFSRKINTVIRGKPISFLLKYMNEKFIKEINTHNKL